MPVRPPRSALRGLIAAAAAGGLLAPLLITGTAVAAVDVTSTACPADYVPDAGFVDAPPPMSNADQVERDVVLAINCLAAHGVARGVTQERFDRVGVLNREQTAQFLARIAALLDVELDASDAGFPDLGGRPAAAVTAINQMANLGVIGGFTDGTFGPTRSLSRGQMATLLTGLVGAVATPLAAGGNAFGDDEGSVHEPGINAVAEAGIAAGTAAGAFTPAATVTRQQMALFLARTLEVLGVAPAAVELRDALGTASLADLAAALDAGEVTSVDLVSAYLDRIDRLNQNGPSLNAVRVVDSRAMAAARAADALRASGAVVPPLLGVPVVVKDNIDVAGLPTTAGSVALADNHPVGDAPVITAMKDAGMIIMGKTNLTEFANFMTSGMPGGYSSLGGQVLNPYDLSQTPRGSSAGSGSAMAAGLAAGTVGTETSGSILSPALAASVVGVKPTVGLVASTGIIPISATQDTAGPMTRTVLDAALMLTGMAVDETPAVAGATLDDLVFADELEGSSLQGVRLGVVANDNAQDDPVYQAALQTLVDEGAVLVDVPGPVSTGPSILRYEFKRDLNAYFATRTPETADVRSLADVIAYNQAHAEVALKFGQTTLEASQAIDTEDPATKAEYEANREAGLATSRGWIDGTLASYDVEAIVSNSNAGTTGIGARAGYPTVGVPAGYAPNNRRPVSISFLGTAYAEERLLQLGYAFEQAADVWQSPMQINPTAFQCAFGRGPSCAP